jgi:cyclomaltodextrinase / maltogenic alpha-amylase / neopullulanase
MGHHAFYAGLSALGLLFTSACTQLVPDIKPDVATQPKPSSALCMPNPIGQRSLYLKGSFNQWGGAQSERFTWLCNRYELVTQINGQHQFKVGDEAWSKDADWGAAKKDSILTSSSLALIAKGEPLSFHFQNTYRFVLTPTNPSTLIMNTKTCLPAPLGKQTLFLRGTMNNWGALDSFAFQYSCDAYYLNVDLKGEHSFKVADAKWLNEHTFGATAGGRSTPAIEQALELQSMQQAGAVADISFSFTGSMTIKLDFLEGHPRVTVGGLSFADPNAVAVSDPVALSLAHDSRNLSDKTPFGAVPAGSAIEFNLNTKPGVKSVNLVIEKRRLEGNQELLDYTTQARIPMVLQSNHSWKASHTVAEPAIYGYWFEVDIAGKRYAYQNNQDQVYWTREKGSGGLGSIEDYPESAERLSAVRRFRITAYAANFKVPEWAKDAVYYYIFPERFRNGNLNNDPKPGVSKYHHHTVEIHQQWLSKPFKPKTGDGSDDVYNNDFYGGDLQGIIDKLDYIARLGANVIYMTPIFKAASNHKYDTADYTQIDPGFGTNDDFVRLCKEAKARGIKIMVDASFNHTGADSLYFDRFGNHGAKGAFANNKINPNSPYADWYTFDKTQTEADKQFKGWVGVTDLPELNKASPSYRDYVLYNTDSITKRWLKAGAGGWRMDVTPWVPDEFWREWRKIVKQADPDAMTVAETWFDSSKYFLGDTFDSTMNYVLRGFLLDYANGGNAKKLYANVELLREAYPPQALFALMNVLGSHDQARTLHILGWKDEVTDTKTIELAKHRLRLALLFQMMFPGSPTVYYGDEVGMTGGDDPFNRGAYPWADLGGQPDQTLLEEFTHLIALRKAHPILRQGSLSAPVYTDENVIVLVRQLGNQWAITGTNNLAEDKVIEVELPNGFAAGLMTDLVHQTAESRVQTIKVETNRVKITIRAMSGVLFITKP